MEEHINEFDRYQKTAHTFAFHPKEKWLEYLSLGLSGEAGEISNKAKKVLRGDRKEIDKEDIADELGDVLWYLSEFTSSIGMNLSDIATRNISKLADRKSRGVLKGSGDNR